MSEGHRPEKSIRKLWTLSIAQLNSLRVDAKVHSQPQMEIFSSDGEKANLVKSCLFAGETENKVVRKTNFNFQRGEGWSCSRVRGAVESEDWDGPNFQAVEKDWQKKKPHFSRLYLETPLKFLPCWV